jgi:hypothetical protein
MGKIKLNLQSLQDLEDELLDDEYFYAQHKEKMKRKKPKNNDEEGKIPED